jgi:hypothetical protein
MKTICRQLIITNRGRSKPNNKRAKIKSIVRFNVNSKLNLKM